MFKPNPSAARTLSRSFPRPQLLSARRRLHAQAHDGVRATTRTLAAAAAGTLAGYVAYRSLDFGKEVYADALASTVVVDDRSSQLSLQRIQVEKALANPGVYAWGDNSGKVIVPDSNEKIIKTPRQFHFFDGVLLRDLQLSHNAGVAVDGKGDVLQWGTGYAPGIEKPEATLKGKNIDRVVLSANKVIALSKDKTLYTFPISKELQQDGPKQKEDSWVPGWSSNAEISYRVLKPQLGYLEKITDVAAGREHLLILTSAGRVFSSAAAFRYPTRGQLGIPGLTWTTRPKDQPVDTLHEITSLSSHKIAQIAAGDFHSVALSKSGDLFTFGDNVHGQVGLEYNPETNIYDEPVLLSLSTLYPPKGTKATVTSIAAGGMNTYLQLDVTTAGRTSCEVLACGTGLYGNLGNGRWVHVQGTPVKIKALSNLHEFNEETQTTQPVRLRTLSVGATHAAAVMASSAAKAEYGADALWWGNNEFYQLGTGRRTNSSVPVYIQPLDGVPPEMEKGFTGSASRADVGRRSGVIGGETNGGTARATTGDQVHRFQVANEGKASAGRAVQTVVCGRGNSAVYMKKV